jgi:hypothetical protein
MQASTALTAVSMALAFAILGGVGAAPGSGAGLEVVDRHDARALRDAVRKDATARNLAAEAARVRLEREGFDESDAERMATAIRKRLLKDTESYIESLRGRRFGSMEEVRDSVQIREKILCYDAAAWPEGYGSGRALTFVVDQADVEDLLGRVDSVIRARETSLRDAVRRLNLSREISLADARKLRDFSRARATVRARLAIEEIRGAQFFSKEDAAYYVENAIGAEIDRIQSAVGDPSTRALLLEEARSVPLYGT